jgi:hypothetical protein
MISPTSGSVANSVKDAVSHQRRDQLLQEQCQQNTTDCSQVEVVNHEQKVQLLGLSVPHDFTTPKDDQIVGYQSRCRHWERAQWSLAGFESKVLRQIAHDRNECALEQWPQRQAKRSVESWNAILDGSVLDGRHACRVQNDDWLILTFVL